MFSGKERDAETGLDYFGARYFSGAQGRFTSPDEPFADQSPADPQSWNMYAYVRNNPLKNTDPNGRDCFQGVTSCLNWLGETGKPGKPGRPDGETGETETSRNQRNQDVLMCPRSILLGKPGRPDVSQSILLRIISTGAD